jgi:hypothetical protein
MARSPERQPLSARTARCLTASTTQARARITAALRSFSTSKIVVVERAAGTREACPPARKRALAVRVPSAIHSLSASRSSVLRRIDLLKIDFDQSADEYNHARHRKPGEAKRELTQTARQSQSGRQPDGGRRGEADDTARCRLVKSHRGAPKTNAAQHGLDHATHGIGIRT